MFIGSTLELAMPGIGVPEIDDDDEDLLMFPMVTLKRKREDEEEDEGPQSQEPVQ